jgi:hypothetical protein
LWKWAKKAWKRPGNNRMLESIRGVQHLIASIRADVADLHGAVSHGFIQVDNRLDKLDLRMTSVEAEMRGLGTRITSLKTHQA